MFRMNYLMGGGSRILFDSFIVTLIGLTNCTPRDASLYPALTIKPIKSRCASKFMGSFIISGDTNSVFKDCPAGTAVSSWLTKLPRSSATPGSLKKETGFTLFVKTEYTLHEAMAIIIIPSSTNKYPVIFSDIYKILH